MLIRQEWCQSLQLRIHRLSKAPLQGKTTNLILKINSQTRKIFSIRLNILSRSAHFLMVTHSSLNKMRRPWKEYRRNWRQQQATQTPQDHNLHQRSLIPQTCPQMRPSLILRSQSRLRQSPRSARVMVVKIIKCSSQKLKSSNRWICKKLLTNLIKR